MHALAFDEEMDWDEAIAEQERREADSAEEAARREFECVQALEPS